MKAHSSQTEIAFNRSNFYGFLSVVYTQEPSLHFVKHLKEKEFANRLQDLGVNLSPILEKSEKKVKDELTLEFTRIFLGPGEHLPPYESVHIGSKIVGGKKIWGQMKGSASQEVLEEYQKHHLTLAPSVKDIPDQVGVEFAFMQFLAEKESQSWREKKKKEALSYQEEQKRFLKKHLLPWVPSFCEEVAEFANLHFYRDLAFLTKEFLLSEDKYFRNKY